MPRLVRQRGAALRRQMEQKVGAGTRLPQNPRRTTGNHRQSLHPRQHRRLSNMGGVIVRVYVCLGAFTEGAKI